VPNTHKNALVTGLGSAAAGLITPLSNPQP
jgi:hypothetical protein